MSKNIRPEAQEAIEFDRFYCVLDAPVSANIVDATPSVSAGTTSRPKTVKKVGLVRVHRENAMGNLTDSFDDDEITTSKRHEKITQVAPAAEEEERTFQYLGKPAGSRGKKRAMAEDDEDERNISTKHVFGLKSKHYPPLTQKNYVMKRKEAVDDARPNPTDGNFMSVEAPILNLSTNMDIAAEDSEPPRLQTGVRDAEGSSGHIREKVDVATKIELASPYPKVQKKPMVKSVVITFDIPSLEEDSLEKYITAFIAAIYESLQAQIFSVAAQIYTMCASEPKHNLMDKLRRRGIAIYEATLVKPKGFGNFGASEGGSYLCLNQNDRKALFLKDDLWVVSKNMQFQKVRPLSRKDATVLAEHFTGITSADVFALKVTNAMSELLAENTMECLLEDAPLAPYIIEGINRKSESAVDELLFEHLDVIASEALKEFALNADQARVVLDFIESLKGKTFPITLGLLELGFQDFVRVGNVKKIAKSILPYTAQQKRNDSEELKELQSLLDDRDLAPFEREAVSEAIRKFKSNDNKQLVFTAFVIGVTCLSTPSDTLENIEASILILDECSQITEPISLLPICKFKSKFALLIGDPKQLAPTLPTDSSNPVFALERTLFERLAYIGLKPILLRTQYRCHPKIGTLASELYYEKRLTNGKTNVEDGKESAEGGGGSLCNREEADVIAGVVGYLLDQEVPVQDIGIITFFRRQCEVLTECLMISTVDAFQGAEKSVVILSTTKTNDISSSLATRGISLNIPHGDASLNGLQAHGLINALEEFDDEEEFPPQMDLTNGGTDWNEMYSETPFCEALDAPIDVDRQEVVTESKGENRYSFKGLSSLSKRHEKPIDDSEPEAVKDFLDMEEEGETDDAEDESNVQKEAADYPPEEEFEEEAAEGQAKDTDSMLFD
ncbi:P-loop containing nucleoside triphosphate hydrolase protein [Chytridium lagenaria]|nr:P-loop containing nucleoside triphosphate hydrolase protein [Chytridium lagenaria]